MENQRVILFDGVCNLCSASVQYVIERDYQNLFKFASLQSNFGQEVLEKHQLPVDDFDSFILLENNEIYQRSTAALKVAKHLNWPIKALFIFIIIPPFIRNFVYNIIAKNRYKWFGKKNECWLPTPDLKEKFLD